MQRTHFAARRAVRSHARPLRPGPTHPAAQAPPLPIEPDVLGFHVAGYVDGAGKVHLASLARRRRGPEKARPW